VDHLRRRQRSHCRRIFGPRITVMPIGLDPEAGYEVMSMDFGLVGHATGLELMIGGISLYASPASAAHLLMISPWVEPSPPPEPTGATVR
jgi:hypothetical protein